MEATLDAAKRQDRGKNEARRHRAGGRLPAVVYGVQDGAVRSDAVSVDPKALGKILHSESGANTLITLQLEGEAPVKVLVKDFQLDPVTHSLLHADFYRVAMDKAIVVTVPVVLKGDARGVKQQGGVLDFVTRQIDVSCLPGEIPEHIEIDVTELLLHQSVRLKDVTPAAGWTPVTDGETMLVHVVAARAEEPAPGAEAAAPAATAEPELIKKGKGEKDEEEKEKK